MGPDALVQASIPEPADQPGQEDAGQHRAATTRSGAEHSKPRHAAPKPRQVLAP